jgi:nicotinate phosphoribosyltransferase
VEVAGRDTAKWSEDKTSLPGAKQLFRFPDRDLLALASEPPPQGAEPLLRPVISKGQLVGEPPALESIRQRAAESMRTVKPRPLEHSEALTALMHRVRSEPK